MQVNLKKQTSDTYNTNNDLKKKYQEAEHKYQNGPSPMTNNYMKGDENSGTGNSDGALTSSRGMNPSIGYPQPQNQVQQNILSGGNTINNNFNIVNNIMQVNCEK
jgi:hypothetical protein